VRAIVRGQAVVSLDTGGRGARARTPTNPSESLIRQGRAGGPMWSQRQAGGLIPLAGCFGYWMHLMPDARLAAPYHPHHGLGDRPSPGWQPPGVPWDSTEPSPGVGNPCKI